MNYICFFIFQLTVATVELWVAMLVLAAPAPIRVLVEQRQLPLEVAMVLVNQTHQQLKSHCLLGKSSSVHIDCKENIGMYLIFFINIYIS